MLLSVACQMDPIDRIDIAGDSTFALLLEAQRRGHALFYYTPPNLALDRGRLLARGTTLAVEDKPGDHYKVSEQRTVDLSDLDAVLLRQDPPFDMAYITTTHLLERIHPRTLVVNRCSRENPVADQLVGRTFACAKLLLRKFANCSQLFESVGWARDARLHEGLGIAGSWENARAHSDGIS